MKTKITVQRDLQSQSPCQRNQVRGLRNELRDNNPGSVDDEALSGV